MMCSCLKNKRGGVLVLVVWVLSVLSFFAIYLSSNAMFSIDLMERFRIDLKEQYLAESAVPYAVTVLASDFTPGIDASNESWLNDTALFKDVPVGEGFISLTYEAGSADLGTVVRYGLSSEDSKINLNTAERDVLAGLFTVAADLDQARSLELADAIIDWRDEDTDKTGYGAEDRDYKVTYGYECKDAPFETVQELRLIYGMNEAIYARVRPFVTVFGSGRVNMNMAPREVLMALGLSSLGAETVRYYRAGNDSVEGTSDDQMFVNPNSIVMELNDLMPIEDIQQISKLLNDKILGVMTQAFFVSVEAKLMDKDPIKRIACVFNREGEVLFWNEI